MSDEELKSLLASVGWRLHYTYADGEEEFAGPSDSDTLRDDHIAGTRLDTNPGNWCAEDGIDCEFVCSWNDAAAAIRKRSNAS